MLFTLFPVNGCWELSNAIDPPDEVPVDEVVDDDPPLDEECEWGANDCSINWTVWFWITCWMCWGLLEWCITVCWLWPLFMVDGEGTTTSWLPPFTLAVEAYSWWRVLSITESLPTTLDLGFLLFLESFNEQQQLEPQHGALRSTLPIRERNWKAKNRWIY